MKLLASLLFGGCIILGLIVECRRNGVAYTRTRMAWILGVGGAASVAFYFGTM